MASVLVVRESDSFSLRLNDAGIDVENLSLIEIRETGDAARLAAKIAQTGYHGIFVTSRHAAEIVAREWTEIRDFDGDLFVLGRKSFEILRDKALRLSFWANAATAAEMLSAIPPDQIENKRFLFVRGDRSMVSIAEFLNGRAMLDELVVYRTETVSLTPEQRRRIQSRSFDLVCFFSPSGVDGLIENLGNDFLLRAETAAIGQTTAAYLRRHGSEPRVVSPKSDVNEFADAVIRFLSGS